MLVLAARLKAGMPAGLLECDQPDRSRSVAFAKHQLLCSGVIEMAWAIDDHDDVRDAAGDMFRPDMARHHLDGFNPVLQRDDDGVGADQRAKPAGRDVDVVQLDGEEHDIHRPDRVDVIGRAKGGQPQVAVGTGDFQSLASQRRQLRSTRDEGDVFTSRGQPAAKVRADSTRPEDRDLHRFTASRLTTGSSPTTVAL